MRPKINEKFISIPPFISTSWEEVMALQVDEGDLIVILKDSSVIEVPSVDPEVLQEAFESHASYLEKKKLTPKDLIRKRPTDKLLGMGIGIGGPSGTESSFRFGMGPIDGVGGAMQHNPEHMHAPDLPKEILHKIAAIAQIVSGDQNIEAPQAEPHCNCPHCQIARAIAKTSANSEKSIDVHGVVEEEVLENELCFQQWDIIHTGDKLYTVVNKLDTDEKYSVYLGHPVGCTCGKDGCEHILAVLKS
jgi:hypothetical protein